MDNNNETGTPEDLARQLFSTQPGTPCSKQILAYSKNQDNDSVSFLFEILLTIYLEGFMYMLDIARKNAPPNTSDTVIYNNMTPEELRLPDPWFQTIGFSIKIEEFNNNSTHYKNLVKPKSYCRILLAFDSVDKPYFFLKNIDKPYTFLLCNTYTATNKLDKIYAILNRNDKSYKIYFEAIYK